MEKDASRLTSFMAGERETSVMGDEKSADRVTSVMDSQSGKTSIMDDTVRATFTPSLSVGQMVCGRKVESVIAENTGEATLLLAGDESAKVVIKMYHSGKQPKAELAKLIASLDSPYITRPLETDMHEGRYCEMLPYFSAGDLASQNVKWNESQLISLVVKSVNEGLNVLHNAGIVHRDIKPNNLFMSNTLDYVVIGDFGISSVLNQNVSVRATTMSRTLGYAAPETSAGFISKESDYYSFGITLLHLILGRDPFAGMTDNQIINLTINKKLEIPYSVSERFSSLIRGLTLKDRSDRWGYDEVSRWLNNENVEVKEVKKTKGVKAYNFNKEKYYSIEDISKAFALDWENAKKHLYRGFVDKYLLQFGEEMASSCIDLKELEDKDVAVFRLIYLLNPYAPLCYKGRFFNDLEHLAKVMRDALPNIDNEILEMLKKGCLEYYIKLDNAYEQGLIVALNDIIKKLKTGDDEFYFAVMYYLDPNIRFVFKNMEFETIQQFADYVLGLGVEQESDFAKELLETPLFSMWIASLGYSQAVYDWKQICRYN